MVQTEKRVNADRTDIEGRPVEEETILKGVFFFILEIFRHDFRYSCLVPRTSEPML